MLDSEARWYIATANGRNHFYLSNASSDGKPEWRQSLLCSHAPCWLGGWENAPHGSISTSSTDSFQLGFTFNEGFYTLVTFKEWLKQNPVTVYYELAEPIHEPSSTHSIRTYDGVTNIFTSSIITPELSVKVPTNLGQKFDEVIESRTAWDNTVHRSLDERLEHDIAMLMDRFNQATSVEYEDSKIVALNSYEGVTRDLVIKGKTLQNLYTVKHREALEDRTFLASTDTAIDHMYSPGTYTIINASKTIQQRNRKLTFGVYKDGSFVRSVIMNVGQRIMTITLEVGEYILQTVAAYADGWSVQITNDLNIIVLKGNVSEKYKYLPHFEGIKSSEPCVIKCTGKNLIDISKLGKQIDNNTFEVVLTSKLFEEGILNNDKEGRITISYDAKLVTAVNFRCDLVYSDNSFTSTASILQSNSFEHRTVTSDVNKTVEKIRFNWTTAGTIQMQNLQIEFSAAETAYEVYTEERLEVTEPLKGINGVCDTTDGMSRIGIYIFDGSEDWYIESTNANNVTNYYIRHDGTIQNSNWPDKTMCNQYGADNDYIVNITRKGYMLNGSTIFFRRPDIHTIAEMKAEVAKNPIIFYYTLIEPIIGKRIPLQFKTHDGITHIRSEGSLIEPTISCKIPTNISKEISRLRELTE